MTRARKIAIGSFVLLLAVAPFAPRGGDSEDALVPSGEGRYDALATSSTAGPGEITPAMAREIDRVVAAGLAVGRVRPRQSPDALASDLVRCADLEGQRYCLHTGWTHRSESDVRTDVATTARSLALRPLDAGRVTGDLDTLSTLQRVAALSPDERAAAERAELEQAARSVAKVWLLRHEVEGAELPADFLDRHPEARAETTTYRRTTKTHRDYPRREVVLRGRKVSDQNRTYWCGPAAMQMIAWAWQDRKKPQRHWADRLGTTTDGSAISDMVRVINRGTGWDRENRAGPYVVLDVSGYGFGKWLLLNMRHVADYRAPLVLHPVLLKRFYPYLDDDASGHFQVGRGYDKRGDKPAHISYFEPWNQQRFDPSEPFIGRVQWRSAYKSYRANQAHFQRNIGV